MPGLRTKAEPDGNGWKVNGQKLWTTWAQHSDYGVIVARIDPAVAKHKGLTYFWVDMKAPGVTVRPIKLADGGHHVNEVFFDDVRLEDSQRISPVGGGFGVAMATLMIERYSACDPDGFGPSLESFIELGRNCEIGGKPAMEDGRIRQAIGPQLRAAFRPRRRSTPAPCSRSRRGCEPGPEGSLNKLVSVRSRQQLSELAIDLPGALGLGWDREPGSSRTGSASWLSAPTRRIAGGADEMLLNTIAERILGLPQDHRPDKGVPFNQIPRSRDQGVTHGDQDPHHRNARHRASDRSGRHAERRLCRAGERGVQRGRARHHHRADPAQPQGAARRDRALPLDDRQALRGERHRAARGHSARLQGLCPGGDR